MHILFFSVKYLGEKRTKLRIFKIPREVPGTNIPIFYLWFLNYCLGTAMGSQARAPVPRRPTAFLPAPLTQSVPSRVKRCSWNR
jgi:hypothetical protein